MTAGGGDWRGRVAAAAAALTLLAVSACGGAESGADGGQETYSLSLANYFGPPAAQSRGVDWWVEQVQTRSGGRLEIEVFYSEALLDLVDTLPGVRSGRADIALGTHGYQPAELPMSQVVGIPFVTSNAYAQGRTLNELYQEYEPFRQEWQGAGVELLFWFAVSPSTLACPFPVQGLEDLNGKRIRGFGYVNEALQIIGASPTALSATEVRDSIERGLLDCSAGIPFDINADFGLHEVAPHIYDMRTGNYAASQLMMNSGVFESLPNDLQQIVLDTSRELTEQWMDIYRTADEAACQVYRDNGVTLGVLPDSAAQQWEQAVGDQLLQQFLADASTARAPAQEFYDEYTTRMDSIEAGYDGYLPGIAECLDPAA